MKILGKNPLFMLFHMDETREIVEVVDLIRLIKCPSESAMLLDSGHQPLGRPVVVVLRDGGAHVQSATLAHGQRQRQGRSDEESLQSRDTQIWRGTKMRSYAYL